MMGCLVDEPMPPRSRRPGVAARYRSEGPANAIMGTVGEFLSWCCLQDLPEQDRQALADLINQCAQEETDPERHLATCEAPETSGLLV